MYSFRSNHFATYPVTKFIHMFSMATDGEEVRNKMVKNAYAYSVIIIILYVRKCILRYYFLRE